MEDEQFQRQKKILTQYLDRATEVENFNPKIAYYCRQYASEQVISLGEKNIHPKVRDVLIALLDKLEETKKEYGFGCPEDQKDCEVFAQMIFAKADKRDRSGTTDATTRSIFYSAWQFFNVASQFKQPLSETSSKLRKYSMWRATDIQKALKAGQHPDAPPPIEGLQTGLGEEAEEELMAALENLPGVPASLPNAAVAALAPAVDATPPPPPPPSPLPAVPFPSPSPSSAAVHARRFNMGQYVLYCCDGTVHCEKEEGIITSVNDSSPSPLTYSVKLLKSHTQVTVPGELLAPVIEIGSVVRYHPENEESTEDVLIEEVFASRWPPSYMIKRQDKGLEEVEDDRLEILEANALVHSVTITPVPSPLLAGDAAALPSTITSHHQQTSSDSGAGVMVNQHANEEEPSAPPAMPSAPQLVPVPAPQPSNQQPPVAHPVVAVPVQPSSTSTFPTTSAGGKEQGYAPPLNALVEAQKAAKSAASALSFEDSNTAIKLLKNALELLTKPNEHKKK